MKTLVFLRGSRTNTRPPQNLSGSASAALPTAVVASRLLSRCLDAVIFAPGRILRIPREQAPTGRTLATLPWPKPPRT